MFTYLTLFLVALALALLFTPAVRRQAVRWGALDVPNDARRIHRRPIPRLGGIAIFLAFIFALALAPLLGTSVSGYFRAHWGDISGLLLPAALIFLFGVYDDFRGATAKFKLLVQTVAAALLYAYGFGFHSVSLPFGGNWDFPLYLSFPATWLWVVGITNAFNLIDGMDGLAAGASGFALLSIFLASLTQGHQEICVLAVALLGAVIGFLNYNFHPASIFMGDSGSLFLGFMAAALSLAGSNKGTTVVAIAIPLVSFGLPVMEVAVSIVRRFIGGQDLLAGDRAHIHHKLLERGLTQRQAATLLYAVCAGFSLFGLLLLNPARSLAAGVFIVIAAAVTFGVRHLKYPEFAELENQLRSGVKLRRRRLMLNVRLRQAGEELGQARDAEHLFAVLAWALEANDFEGVMLEVGAPDEAEQCGLKGIFCLYPTDAAPHGWRAGEDDKGRVVWCWERDGQRVEEMRESDTFWQLRLPLISDGRRLGAVTFYHRFATDDPAIDLRHLCGSFQKELSAALARLIHQSETAGKAGAQEAVAAQGMNVAGVRPQLLAK